ncbi:MAG TPA: nucleotidyltransferase family protein [Thermoanaerobaculia bacterium]|nr:nucleotidyltransferase family protein [Thermoanaerobaculia bacterium]
MRPEPGGAVAGVVLAAGSSTRMGSNKLLLRLEGESLVRRAARQALAAGLDPVVVVLGHEADLAAAELAGLAVRIVVNADHAGGIHTSRVAGLAAVPPEAAAAIVLLADMPYVTEAMLAALAARHRETGARLVVSEYAGEQAPPTLYDRSLFPELSAGEGCSKRVIRTHAGEAATLSWPASALRDLDRPEDYERALAGGPDAEAPCAPSS